MICTFQESAQFSHFYFLNSIPRFWIYLTRSGIDPYLLTMVWHPTIISRITYSVLVLCNKLFWDHHIRILQGWDKILIIGLTGMPNFLPGTKWVSTGEFLLLKCIVLMGSHEKSVGNPNGPSRWRGHGAAHRRGRVPGRIEKWNIKIKKFLKSNSPTSWNRWISLHVCSDRPPLSWRQPKSPHQTPPVASLTESSPLCCDARRCP